MKHYQRIRTAALLNLCGFLLVAFAVQISARYYAPELDIDYSTPISVLDIPGGFASTSVEMILAVLGTPFQIVVFHAVPMTLAVLAIFLVHLDKSTASRWVFALQSLWLLLGGAGLVGLLSLGITLLNVNNMDGEWLGEHWPVVEMNGVWAIIAMYLALSRRGNVEPDAT